MRKSRIGTAVLAVFIVCVLPAPGRAAPPVQAVGTFNTNPPSPSADASCENPDRDETNSLSDTEGVTICFTDQFGNPTQAEGTLESTGVGHFSACTGTLHDHDGDGLNEHCHVRTNASGQGFASINNPTFTPGDQTILVCADPQNDRSVPSPGNPPSTGHGCADETFTDALNKHWRQLPEHIHLVFEGTGDPADPCHTGDTFKENYPGDVDELLACTFDNTPAHSPATTEQPDGGAIYWRIVPSGGGELTATRFQTSPPCVTGPDGLATAQIDSYRPGNDIIVVQLLDEFGNVIAEATVQKRLTVGDRKAGYKVGGSIESQSDPNCFDEHREITYHEREVSIDFDHVRTPDGSRRLVVSGRVTVPDGFDRCRSGILVKVKKFLPRWGLDWVIRKSDITNQRGKYAVEIKDLADDYRARAVRHEFQDEQYNLDVCQPATQTQTHMH